MSEEEYEEEFDRKKVALFVLGIALAAVVIIMFVGGFTGYFIIIPEDIEQTIITEIEKKSDKTPEQIIQEYYEENVIPKPEIKPEYQKYLDFGLSTDDIIDIQDMDCFQFLGNGTLLSPDPKYTEIFEQRRGECQ